MAGWASALLSYRPQMWVPVQAALAWPGPIPQSCLPAISPGLPAGSGYVPFQLARQHNLRQGNPRSDIDAALADPQAAPPLDPEST